MQASFFAATVFALFLATATLPGPAQADPAIPLSECREQSIDQPGFDECLSLLAQQSDGALHDLEIRWIDKLSEVREVDFQSATAENTDLSQSDTDSATVNTSRVISIVSEGADVEVLDGSRVINIDGDTLTSDDDADSAFASAALLASQFAELPALFRQYRDQRCEWEAGLLGSDRSKGYLLACEISLNRLKSSQLRRLLVEKNAADAGGESFQGFYVATASGGIFQSCDRRQDWWVTGTDETLDVLQRRYNDIAAENLELVYVELRGTTRERLDEGPGADFVSAVEVVTINLMRPILERDCRAAPIGLTLVQSESDTDELSALEADDTVDPPIEETPALTVDELGDAGFLYGYFSNWISACAVDNLIVCQAQTQADYASEGEWMLSVDRSSQRSWRVRLIPTTENHQVGGSLSLTIDEIENTVANVSATELELGRGVSVAIGQRAREIITRLRAGRSLDIEWTRPDQVGAKVSFSLAGITRGLQYFNQAEK